MATVVVNGQEIEIADDERLNGIQVAARAGVEIPHYCWHPGLSVVASCRMCLVESGRRDPTTGDIQMIPKLVPACQTPATDGTIFITDSEKVDNARAMVEEDLLIRHPIDCPICDKAGECALQDYHFEYGQSERRADLRPFTSRRRPLGETVTLFVDRCVMCSRCVRFCREISGSSELMVKDRGAHEEIDIFPGYPLENKLSGNVVDLCPVGALGDVDFLYQQRVWFMRRHAHVCPGCSTGCSIYVEENQDRIYRVKPRDNPDVNQWWICDEGRYGWKAVHDKDRRTDPQWLENEQYVNVEWSALPARLETLLSGNGPIAAVISPHLTVEEVYLLAKYLRGIDSEAMFAVGPVPRDGDDETFPNGFTIRAEKCPNLRGIEAVLDPLADPLLDWDQLLEKCKANEISSVWVTGGYSGGWHDQQTADLFQQVKTVIVQDMLPSPLWDLAHVRIPGAAFAERAGSFVNHADHLQSFEWAIRPPAGVMVEGSFYWRLLGRSGMYQAPRVLDELAAENAYFAAAAGGVADTGIDLKVNLVV